MFYKERLRYGDRRASLDLRRRFSVAGQLGNARSLGWFCARQRVLSTTSLFSAVWPKSGLIVFCMSLSFIYELMLLFTEISKRKKFLKYSMEIELSSGKWILQMKSRKLVICLAEWIMQ